MLSVMNTTDFELDRNSDALQEELRPKPRVSEDSAAVAGISDEVSNGLVDEGAGPNSIESEGTKVSIGAVGGGADEATTHGDGDEGSGDEDIGDSMKIEETAEETEKFSVFEFSDQNGGKEQLDSSVETEKVRVRVNSIQRESSPSPIESKIHFRNVQSESTAKSSCSQYDSMLSMFDEFAATGRIGDTAVGPSKTEGNGFENGDMVWGKVKSHPWWPGQIFSEAFASPSVRRSKREGYVLVAFFGDSSYGWFEEAELVPFDPNFDEKSKQTHSRTFTKAVEEAIDEASRRSALGLACMCRNPYNFRPANVKGYFAVDVSDYEPGAVYSAKQIGKARVSFQPKEVLAFVKRLAVTPTSNEREGLEFFKKKATVLAYRKAVFEEFDETYAQAFGHQPERRPPGKAQDAAPARAPLSGRLVIAESLGKGKNSATKPNKPKEQSKRDKYLFKRRDETDNSKTHPINQLQATSTAQPVNAEGSSVISPVDFMLQKRPPTISTNTQVHERTGAVAGDSVSGSNFSEEKPLVEGSDGAAGPASRDNFDPNAERVDFKDMSSKSTVAAESSGPKKVKVRKRPSGEMSSEKSILLEKKKMRKTELMTSKKVGEVMGKSTGKQVQIPSAPREDFPVTHQKKDDRGIIELRFPKLLSELQALAIDPFHCLEKSPAVVRKVFLKFRSIVYQKSLSSMPSAETEPNESRPRKSPAHENPPIENIKDPPSLKPAKPPVRSEDQTKSSLKRGPSDRQEEKRAKKKKFDDVKALASDKKAAQRTTEPNRGDRKETVAAPVSRPVKLEPSVKRPEPPVRAPNPTMLVMKFPPHGNLPSLNELKARFARFGPLDHSLIRVFWQTSTCRVVFRHKLDAQAAYKFAVGSTTLFGNTNVRCFFREMDAAGPDSESSKADASTVATEQWPVAPPPPQPVQQPGVQLKSILKRSAGDEGSSNGGGRGAARVKFVLGGEESNRGEQLMSGNKNNFNNNASFVDGSSSTSSSSQTMDFNSKNFQKFIPPSPSPNFPVPNSQFSRPPPVNTHYNEVLMPRNGQIFNAPLNPPTVSSYVDVSQQMIALLTRCNDVVNRVTGFLGYVPYHPL